MTLHVYFTRDRVVIEGGSVWGGVGKRTQGTRTTSIVHERKVERKEKWCSEE